MLRCLKSEYAAGVLLRTHLVLTIDMILLLLLALLCNGSQAQNDKYQLQVQPVVRAQKGVCVFVPCNFTYAQIGWSSYNTYGFWYRQYQQYNNVNGNGDLVATNDQTKKVSPGTQGRFKLVGSPKDGNCSLLITNVQESDKGVYFFRVERGNLVKHNYIKATVSLEVTDRTQPDVYIPEPLWSNRWGTVICVFNATFEGCPPPSFSWTGPVLSTSQSQVSNHQSSVLKFTPQPQDHGNSLTCTVRFAPQGQIFQKTVRLDVAYAPKDLIIHAYKDKGTAPLSHAGASTSFHLQAQHGSFLQLLCEASSNPPASLSWSLGNRVLACSRPEDPKTLTLELPSVLVGDSGSYTCRAENILGQEMRVVHLEVQYPPEDVSVTVSVENRTVLQTIRKANTLEVLQGQSLQLRCVAHSSPPATLSWTRGPLPQSSVLPTEPGLLLLPQIQPYQEGEFTCQAQNQLGSQEVSVTIHVYSSPQLLGLHCSWEALALHCSCLASGRPVPALHWWLGSKLLPENRSEASVQLSIQGLWANSSLKILREFYTGVTLSCQAWNIHGAQNGSVLLLPDEKGTLRGAFSNGVLVGTSIMGLLFLTVILILVIFLRRRGKQTKQLSRGSTILDYINILPRSGFQVPNQEAESHGLSQPPPPASSPQPRMNPKQKPQEEHCAGSHAEATPPPQFSQDQEDEVQYSHLHFPGRRPRVLQAPKDSHEEYVEIRFH